MLLPPGRLSMMTGCPSFLLSSSASVRAMTSVPLPAPKGTTSVIARVGYGVCADALTAVSSAMQVNRIRVIIEPHVVIVSKASKEHAI